jgi:hypothetical protein
VATARATDTNKIAVSMPEDAMEVINDNLLFDYGNLNSKDC